jgi:hypothetical protein
MPNTIQEQFGQAVIDSMKVFFRNDIRTPAQLGADEFSHIGDQVLKKTLCETLYGSRYMYKLGLAALTDGIEQYGIVRIQIIDYISICEAILGHMIFHAKNLNILKGTQYQYFDTQMRKRMRWATNPATTIDRTSFEWKIIVAFESGIIDAALKPHLDRMRIKRNSVHLTAKINQNITYYSRVANNAYTTLYSTIEQTKAWIIRNP